MQAIRKDVKVMKTLYNLSANEKEQEFKEYLKETKNRKVSKVIYFFKF